ncbi:MAG: bifunctional DedA family/phosphatase PAP2 family protein, partial [Gemmatimonadales bacterium]
ILARTEMSETIAGLVATYGYLFVFTLVGLESLGIPLPGETALVTAAAYAALGHLNIFLVIAAAAAGAIIGDSAGYWIGRKGGRAFVLAYGKKLHLNESHLAKAEKFFVKHGGKTVFIGRFIALLRSWAAVLAGMASMPYGEFTAFNASGGIVWASIFGALGYLFGRSLPTLERYVGQASLALVLLAALTVLLILVSRWLRANQDLVMERLVRIQRKVFDSTGLTRVHREHPRIWMFFADRFARGEYLGLHLTIGLLISVGGLWLFAGVTEDVLHNDPLTTFDVTVLRLLRDHSTHLGDRIFSAITLFGSPVAMAALGVIVAAVLAVKRQWILLAGWFAAFIGAGILTATLKTVIQRPRPTGANQFLHGESFSFPSGHALGSLIGYGMLAYLLIRVVDQRRTKTLVVGASLALVLAIGFSRLYLGVHYFSDIVAGYAAGVLWLSACISGLEIVRRRSTLLSPPAASDQAARKLDRGPRAGLEF